MTNVYGQYKGMIFVACSVVLSACAQLLMKFGMLTLAAAGGWSIESFGPLSLSEPALQAALLWVLAGLFSYATSMLFWMAALARYELSLAYPMLSLSYVLVYIGAALLPGYLESFSVLRSAGIVLIVIGVILVTRSKSATTAAAV